MSDLHESERVVCSITLLEIRSALRRREAFKELSAENTAKEIGRLERLLPRFFTVFVGNEVLAGATRMVDRHRLRALDALPLAAALTLLERDMARQLTFIASDDALLRAAVAVGLQVLDPRVEETIPRRS